MKRATRRQAAGRDSQAKAAQRKAAEPGTHSDIVEMKIVQINVRIVGDAPLISHAWSAKAKKMMLDKQMKRAKPARDAKDPKQDYYDSLYRLPDSGGYGFPAVAFKSAAVDACSHVDGITKVAARGAFHIVGDLVALDGKPSLREDMVRIGMGTADIRYRAEFKKWAATINVRLNERVLSVEQLVNLFDTAGFAIGVGDWRPEKNGSFGMFHVDR